MLPTSLQWGSVAGCTPLHGAAGNGHLRVVDKLLEGSWEEGAVVRDGERRIFTHPEKVHEIGHKGKYFDVPGYPSPGRSFALELSTR